MRRHVLMRDGFMCKRCAYYDPTGRTLIVHHRDYSAPFDPDTLTTLCRPCSGELDGAKAHR